MHNCCTPATEVFVCQMKLRHIRMFLQKLVNGFAQLPDAFAVDDPYAQKTPRPTFRQIIQHERLYLTRLKGVQVQHAINRELDGFVGHGKI